MRLNPFRWSWVRELRKRLVEIPIPGARTALFAAALAILAGFTIINLIFLSHLRRHAVTINDREARLYAVAIAEQLSHEEINVIFNEIVRKSEVPMIITDPGGTPINWNNVRRTSFGSSRLLRVAPFFELRAEERLVLVRALQGMTNGHAPLPLVVEGHDFGFLYYGDPPVVRILGWTPLAELVITLLFCFIAYFGFYIIRTNEQTLLWVGLAKETAHQLGTPISSLLGWIDLLRLRLEGVAGNEKTLKVLGEMESDISRLNRVATRFSKIGSLPELRAEDLSGIITFTAKYFQTRLPHLGKRIRIEEHLEELPEIWISAELIAWVLENLLRNAVDSIEAQEGLITISARYAEPAGMVILTVKDNGKGIPKENIKQIFSPGFTTKKRGWGLGLSLCRRIVEEYHQGRIYVARSVKDEGTTFMVELPRLPERVRNKA